MQQTETILSTDSAQQAQAKILATKKKWRKIKHERDSLARVDSIAKVDSIQRVDSLHRVDSLRAIVQVPKGYPGVPLNVSYQTSSWVFGLLVVLFIMLTVAFPISAKRIWHTIKNLFKRNERADVHEKLTAGEYYSRLLLTLFGTGTVSLWALILQKPDYAEESLLNFVYVCGATLVFCLFKISSFRLISYIFLNESAYRLARETYFTLVSLLTILSFPLLLLRIYGTVGYHDGLIPLFSLLGLCTALLIVIKLFQLFFHKMLASFYILLYLCTLEILPLSVLILSYQFLLK